MYYLEKLSNLVGIEEQYTDGNKKVHTIDNKTRFKILNALGYHCKTEKDAKTFYNKEIDYLYLNGLDYTISSFVDTPLKLNLYIPEKYKNNKIDLSFISKDNKIKLHLERQLSKFSVQDKRLINNTNYIKLTIAINLNLSPDYYNIEATISKLCFKSFFILSPKTAYLHSFIKQNKKITGLGLQLYGANNNRSIGVGDFNTVDIFIKESKKIGYNVIGLNPLGILYENSKIDFSPYHTINRNYINYLYIDIKNTRDYKESNEIKKYILSKQYKNLINKINNSKLVDYPNTFKLKLYIFKLMWKNFKSIHMKNKTSYYKEYINYINKEKEDLKYLSLFEVLSKTKGIHWINWKSDYQNIDSSTIEKFVKSHRDEINFYNYLHFLAHKQMLKLKQKSNKIGVHLYLDIPVGTPVESSEGWQNKSLFVKNVEIGAPPDGIRTISQTWGLTPYSPVELNKQNYKPFIKLINSTMKYANIIRLDHAFSLYRLFWILKENSTEEYKAYINYNFEILISILCLESYKNKCMVVGEDLGNAPHGFTSLLKKYNILSTKVLFHKQYKTKKYLSEDFPYLSLCQTSTHDQATSLGFWNNVDIETNKLCNLYETEQQYNEALKYRDLEKQKLLNIFDKTSSFYKNKNLLSYTNPFNVEYNFNIYGAKTTSSIFLVRLEEILRSSEMQNVPGTFTQYYNWKIKLTSDIKQNLPIIAKFFKVINKYRQ